MSAAPELKSRGQLNPAGNAAPSSVYGIPPTDKDGDQDWGGRAAAALARHSAADRVWSDAEVWAIAAAKIKPEQRKFLKNDSCFVELRYHSARSFRAWLRCIRVAMHHNSQKNCKI